MSSPGRFRSPSEALAGNARAGMTAGEDHRPADGHDAASARPKGRLARAVREPLFHFLLAGIAIFAAYGALHPERFRSDDSRRIVVTEHDLRRIEIMWTARWQRPPQPAELRALVEAEVREEILYREALALGLDAGDRIVRRRLAQKMEFLAEDTAAIREPGAAELRDWFEARKGEFASPPRATFRHVYFAFDHRGARAEDDARRAQLKLASLRPAPAESAVAGDAFMFQMHYAERTPEQVASVFGGGFAEALFALAPGAWAGPIESGYGWHLVWVDALAPGRVPAFEAIEAQVKSEWIAEQRAAAKRKAYEAMRSRYVVVLPAAN